MSASVKIFVAAGAAALLSACAGHLSEAETAAPPADAFAAALQSGYVALARAERDENDFGDARSFAARALDAAAGRPPAPESLGARRLPQESVPELADARARLMRALDAGARSLSPHDAAEAQFGFDCWMQEQEENFQPDDIAGCRARFLAAAASLESRGLAA
ncbi:MAG: OmpA family protein, partial [Rhodospirillaceae bacterium]